MFKVEIYIDGQRVDLFDDENIEVVSSVQNIEDINRTFNDFSQSFTVPATPNNNKIFKHWYNFSINNGFDARIRHKGHIDIQSNNFKQGSFRLEDCKIENKKPAHYKLTFFGQLIDLKKVVGDDYLDRLPLSEYDIDYTPDNIKTAIQTGFNSGDYIVPLISAKRQWFYNSNSAITTLEDKLVNIAWNGSAQNHGIEWTSLRPALRVRAIIDKIQEKYGLTFTNDFFSLPVFDNLYLWLANEDTEDTLKSIYRVTDYNGWVTFQQSIGSFDNTTGAYTPTSSGADNIREIIARAKSSDGVLYSVQVMNGDTVLEEKSGTGDITIVRNTPGGFQPGATLYLRIVTNTNKTIDSLEFQVDEFSDDQVLGAVKINFQITGSTATTVNFMPKIKVMDFLKSIINAYNLIVEPTSETDFYFETLNKWYEQGNIYDVSKYIDTTGTTYSRPKIYRDIAFKFQEPQTILAEEFANTNNTAYGDLETKLNNAQDEHLDGDEYEIELDFEQMVYEKLLDLRTNEETNIVYGLSADMSIEPVTPEPHIFYAVQKSVSANPISFLDDTGTKSQLNGNVYMPSHADSDSQNYSTAWGGEVNEHTGGINENSLYKLYYDDYIKDTFSIKRRKVDLDARLPIWLLTTLKLNDRLVINGDRYIINEMTTNVTTQKVKFSLLNDVFGLDSDIEVQEETPPNPTQPTPPPVVAGSFTMSATGSPSPSGGCALVPNVTRYWNGSEPQPTLADVIYTNVGLTTIFNGQNNYFKIENDRAIRINNQGIVIDVFFCAQGQGGGNQ